MKLTKKVDYLLEVYSAYTYRIYPNGNGEITIEVQLTKDFKAANLRNFALATTSKENFNHCITVDYLNRLFSILKQNIRECGRYATIECNYLPQWKD